MKVIVGSTNPVKVEAVRIAFTRVWPEQAWEIQGISVPSGIASQPMSDEESIAGARNRARNAIDVHTAIDTPDVAYGVGLEGGIQRVGTHYYDSGWCVVLDKQGREGIGSTIHLVVPPKMMRMIQQGKELGEVIDIVFQQENSKQAMGHFGLMTNNAVTRAGAYADGVVSALARFIHPELFT